MVMKSHTAWLSLRHLVVFLAIVGMVISCSDKEGGNDGPFSVSGDLKLASNPEKVNFGSVVIGDSVSREVVLTHVGTSGTLYLTSFALNSASTEFSLTEPTVTQLEPGESTTLTVAYAPTDAVYDTGSIQIGTNIAAGASTLVFEIPIVTLAPYGDLIALPSVLDFGGVNAGQTVTKPLKFRNLGSIAVTVQAIAIKGGGSPDFNIVTTPSFPLGVESEKEFEIEVSYTPTMGDVDSAHLIVTFLSGDQVTEFSVLLQGAEVGPRLAAFPNPVDFGSKAPGQTYETEIFIANQGQQPLVISSVSVLETSPETSATIGIKDFPAEGLTLTGADTATVTVTFTPTAEMPVMTSPIAGVVMESNDPAGGGQLVIPVFGRPEVPALQVNPPELVDFGFVAQNLTTVRKINLYNAGSAPLTVTSLTLSGDVGANPGEYAFVGGENWGPTSASPVAAVIDAGGFKEVKVGFTNKGGSNGEAWGSLQIASNDGQGPVWDLTLKAQRAGAPNCRVELVPDQMDFGVVPRGFSKTLKFQLVNTGSGKCGFHSAFVNDCASWAGFFGTDCSDPNLTVQTDGTSDFYTVTEKPFSAANNLEPGMSYPLSVTFTPPETAPLFGDEMTDYAALLAVRVTHNYTNDGSSELLVFPEPTGGSYPANLHAKSGMAELAVFPQALDFGLVTIGCHSKTLTISAYNVGTAPLSITDWELVGCTPEFKLKSEPVLPINGELVLQPSDGVEYQVVYAPQDGNEDACSLAIYTNGADTPAAVVPLEGGGTLESEQTDEFIQKSGQDVDVLFVVDSSGSMSEEQNNLSTNFSTFINQAATWQNDYQVGVITMDLEGDSGLLKGTPRFVTKSDWNAFPSNVKVGSNGSGTEQGLAAAQVALSLPLISNSTQACGTDADCAAPDGCVDGFCGGHNRGFLRKDASLEIVFVSDEDDQSPADLSFYENFFKNIKGFFNANLMHIHAIVGPSGGCSSGAGDAVAGHRYMDLANATGGNVISICESNFAAGLKSIGEIAFGLKVQFFLSRTPDPSTIEVKVNGAPCAANAGGVTNWTYDGASDAIVFNEAGGCMPQPGENIWVHYETLCLTD